MGTNNPTSKPQKTPSTEEQTENPSREPTSSTEASNTSTTVATSSSSAATASSSTMYTTTAANQIDVSTEMAMPTMAYTSSSTLQTTPSAMTSAQLATISDTAVPETETDDVLEGKEDSVGPDGSNQEVSTEEEDNTETKNDANNEAELAKHTAVVQRTNSSSEYSHGTLMFLTMLGTAVNLMLKQ